MFRLRLCRSAVCCWNGWSAQAARKLQEQEMAQLTKLKGFVPGAAQGRRGMLDPELRVQQATIATAREAVREAALICVELYGKGRCFASCSSGYQVTTHLRSVRPTAELLARPAPSRNARQMVPRPAFLSRVRQLPFQGVQAQVLGLLPQVMPHLTWVRARVRWFSRHRFRRVLLCWCWSSLAFAHTVAFTECLRTSKCAAAGHSGRSHPHVVAVSPSIQVTGPAMLADVSDAVQDNDPERGLAASALELVDHAKRTVVDVLQRRGM